MAATHSERSNTMSDLSDLLELPGAAIETDADFDAINALWLERGWGDGLPIVPPTAERVERMLAWCDRPWNEPIAKVAPRYGEATPLKLALFVTTPFAKRT
jgi:hypothetical protein